jgi:hypothetical protein
MSGINTGLVHDVKKRLDHRLVAARIRRDPRLIELAKAQHARMAERYSDWSFHAEWGAILSLPAEEIRRLICSRDPEMDRLRISSPFFLAEGIDDDYEARVRRMRAARRIVEGALGLPLTPKRRGGRPVTEEAAAGPRP